MKTILVLLVIAFASLGLHYYSNTGALNNVRIEDDTVIVDAGDFEASFSATGEFLETYMVFGGGYFQNKNLVNPISLSGLKIADTKDIYKKFPDFSKSKKSPSVKSIPLELAVIFASCSFNPQE